MSKLIWIIFLVVTIAIDITTAYTYDDESGEYFADLREKTKTHYNANRIKPGAAGDEIYSAGELAVRYRPFKMSTLDRNIGTRHLFKYSVQHLAQLAHRIIYDRIYDDENIEDSVNRYFKADDLEALLKKLELEHGYRAHMCSHLMTSHDIFYRLTIGALKATIEYTMDERLSMEAERTIEAHYPKSTFVDMLTTYEKRVLTRPHLDDCGGNGPDVSSYGLVMPYSLYKVNVTENVNPNYDPYERCEQMTDYPPPPPLPLNEYYTGSADFRFNVEFEDAIAGKDYYLPIAIGSKTTLDSGQYFIYYGSWGYIGLEPLNVAFNMVAIRIFYGSYGPNSTIVQENGKNCRNGAVISTTYEEDLPEGIICSLEYQLIYFDKVYYFRIVLDENTNIYTGYFMDPHFNAIVSIGSFMNRWSSSSDKKSFWQEDSNGLIGSYDREIGSCCQMQAVEVFVGCPIGSGITCRSNGKLTEAANTICQNIYSDLYIRNVSFDVAIATDNYNIQTMYIRRGWIPNSGL